MSLNAVFFGTWLVLGIFALAHTWNGQYHVDDIGNVVEQLVDRVEYLENTVGSTRPPGGSIEDAIGDMLEYLGDVHIEINPTGPDSAWIYIMSHMILNDIEHLNIMVILANNLGGQIRVTDVRYSSGSHFVIHVTNM